MVRTTGCSFGRLTDCLVVYVIFDSVVWQTALEIGGINDLAEAKLSQVALALNPLGL